jgi:tetratricopeptide (TPR) repeat protein
MRRNPEAMMARAGRSSQSGFLQEQFEEAVARQRQGNHNGALKRLKRVLKDLPDNPQVLNMYALCLAETGEARKAAQALERAVKADPGHAESWSNLGVLYHEAGDLERAAQAYDRYRALDPGSCAGHVKYADACLGLDRYAEALAAYQQAVAAEPDSADALRGLAQANMCEGQWEQALGAAREALARAPGDTLSLSIVAAASTELGRAGEAAKLVDFDRLIDVRDFAAPEGFADIGSFNDALCAHCLAHPSLVYEPGGKSTMKGHQTGDLWQDKGQRPIGPLLDLIVSAVDGYKETHPLDPSHPFLFRQPERWGCYIWATVLDSGGHQAPHIHPSGWLSGVYYAKVPRTVAANPDSRAGWIEFGRAERYPKSGTGHAVRSYQPREGMAVLFPSYFYHRTEPFESGERRISLAFDIVPMD